MPRRFVALSISLENEVLSDPPMLAPYIGHRPETLGAFMRMLAGAAPHG